MNKAELPGKEATSLQKEHFCHLWFGQETTWISQPVDRWENTAFKLRNLIPSVKDGRSSIMVYGSSCFVASGPGQLSIIENELWVLSRTTAPHHTSGTKTLNQVLDKRIKSVKGRRKSAQCSFQCRYSFSEISTVMFQAHRRKWKFWEQESQNTDILSIKILQKKSPSTSLRLFYKEEWAKTDMIGW